jgi:hypothetical protein
MLAFMDEVTSDNGSITVYLESQDIPCYQKHRGRALDRLAALRSVTLTGPRGTTWLFDSRLLHQSNPNYTEHTRRTMQCFLGTPGMLPLNITS